MTINAAAGEAPDGALLVRPAALPARAELTGLQGLQERSVPSFQAAVTRWLVNTRQSASPTEIGQTISIAGCLL